MKKRKFAVFIYYLFRNRSHEKRSTRFCLCCIFFTAILLATIIVLLSSFLFHPNKKRDDEDLVKIETIWTSSFPKLITETAFRLVDCNSDGILDVIFGFGTGVDTLADNRLLCDLYFNGVYPCNGGVKVKKCLRWNEGAIWWVCSFCFLEKALDGRNGKVLWSYEKSNHEVFALNCQRDIDGDQILDCLTGGRGGVS